MLRSAYIIMELVFEGHPKPSHSVSISEAELLSFMQQTNVCKKNLWKTGIHNITQLPLLYAFCVRTKATHRTKNTLLLHLHHQINMNNTIVISFTYLKCEYFSLFLLQTMNGWYMFLACNFLNTACNLKSSLRMVTWCVSNVMNMSQ